MKYTIDNTELKIEVTNEPVVTFEKIQIATVDDSEAFIAGPHSWNRLESSSDLTPLFGQCFNMTSEKWSLDYCYVCLDKKTIFFRNAVML